MGCIRVTPKPSYYRELDQAIQIPPEEPTLEDKITICFHVGGVGGLLGTRKQVAIRNVVATALGDRGRYHRHYNNTDDLGYYTWENIVLHQTMLAIGPMEMSGLGAYEPLLDAGVRIFEYSPGFLHAKNFVCDDRYAVVGSVNLDFRSLFLHYECGVWLCDDPAVEAVREDFLATQDLCREIRAEDLPRRRMLGRVALSILRIFSPMM